MVITLVFPRDFKINIITLFDTSVNLNFIKTRIVPRRFHNQTKEKLTSTNSSKMQIDGKAEASILN